MIPTIQIKQVPIAPVNWRPQVISPVAVARLGQEDLSVDLENFDPEQLDPKQLETMMSVVNTVFKMAEGGVLAWVGLATASREEGLLSTLGYTVGILGILRGAGALVGLILSLAGVSLGPKEPEGPPPVPKPPMATAL